jgi:serine/threonine protein kinase
MVDADAIEAEMMEEGGEADLASESSRTECKRISDDDDDSALDPYTLKFRDPEMEFLFMESKHEAVIKSIVYGGAVVAVLAVIITATRLHNPTLIQPEIKRLCIALLGILAALFAKLQKRTGFANLLGFEVSAVLCSTAVLALGAFPSPYHMAQFCGVKDIDPRSGYPYRDAGTLLFIDLVITSTHLLMPFRWCVLWPLEVLAVLAYAVPSVVFGSPHPKDVPFNTMALVCLVGFAALGKRTLEMHERLNFRRLLFAQGVVVEQRIQIYTSSALVTAMNAVAQALCDVVLKISGDLMAMDVEIVHDAFFGCKMQGRCFSDVLAPEDQQRFATLVEQAARYKVPQCLQVTLDRGFGLFKANVLVMPIAMEKICYLVGIRSWEELAPPSWDMVESGLPARSAGMGNLANPSTRLHSHNLYHQEPRGPDEDEQTQRTTVSETSSGRLFESIRYPTQTDSGECFDAILQRQLEEVVKLGKKQHWLLDMNGVQVAQEGGIIAKGDFSVAIPAQIHGTAAVIKTTRRSQQDASRMHEHLLATSHELRILRMVRHPNIALFFGACIDPITAEVALVFEHLSGKPLDRFILVSPELPDFYSRRQLVLDVCVALRYLHANSPCIVHGNLKASNVFVEILRGCVVQAKLLDFGLSRLVAKRQGSQPQQSARLVGWRAPEMQGNNMRPGPPSDVYSFGCLARFVVTGSGPDQTYMATSSACPPEDPKSPEAGCEGTFRSCLDPDSGLRPGMAAVHDMVLAWSSDPHGSSTEASSEKTASQGQGSKPRDAFAGQGQDRFHALSNTSATDSDEFNTVSGGTGSGRQRDQNLMPLSGNGVSFGRSLAAIPSPRQQRGGHTNSGGSSRSRPPSSFRRPNLSEACVQTDLAIPCNQMIDNKAASCASAPWAAAPPGVLFRPNHQPGQGNSKESRSAPSPFRL